MPALVESRLPKKLQYVGEFGTELVTFLPFVRALAKRGELRNRTVSTYKGMAPFYEGLDIGTYEEREAARRWVHWEDRAKWLPVKNEHTFTTPRADYDFGDMRQQFASVFLGKTVESFLAERPIVIIHNKYSAEHKGLPSNNIPTAIIYEALATLMQRFNVIYVRHKPKPMPGYSLDHNEVDLGSDDWRLFEAFPQLINFDILYETARREAEIENINLFKPALYSRCWRFVTSQGGGAHQIAHYSGSLIVIQHTTGAEERHAYKEGYYTFAASPPPTVLVGEGDPILEAIAALASSEVVDGRAVLAPQNQNLLESLSPAGLMERLPKEDRVWFPPRGLRGKVIDRVKGSLGL